ncbi:MAG TPA: hypothetical protein VF608_13230 [Thermoanaerobaculia bacterium]
MKLGTALTIFLLAIVPFTAHADKKKKPLALKVTPATTGLPLVTLTASDEPLGEIADRLAKQLGTTVNASAAARASHVTLDLDEQPLDLALRQLAPQAYLDGILSGGAAGKLEIQAIHLSMAGEPAPSLNELKKRSSEAIMFAGDTEDSGVDPLAGKLEVSYENERLRVFAKQQPLWDVASKLADALRIPLELIGDPRESIDVSVSDATLEQTMRALSPSVKLYQRTDLATLRTTPVRIAVREPFSMRPNP